MRSSFMILWSTLASQEYKMLEEQSEYRHRLTATSDTHPLLGCLNETFS
jgi:hypothetical protein